MNLAGQPQLAHEESSPSTLQWPEQAAESCTILFLLASICIFNFVFCCRPKAGEELIPGARELRPEGRERVDTGALTGLRGLAALHVAFGHYASGSKFQLDLIGGASMSFFYLLSGFIMTLGYNNKLDARRFLRNRVARLLPTYLLTNVLGYALELASFYSMPASVRQFSAPGGAFSLGFNFVLTLFGFNMWAYPANAWLGTKYQILLPSNGVTWTVQTMMVFNFLFPVILPRLQLIRNRPAMIHALYWIQGFTFMAVFALGLCWLNMQYGYWTARAWPLGRLPVFAMGCLAALERQQGEMSTSCYLCCPFRCLAGGDAKTWGRRATAAGLIYIVLLVLGIFAMQMTKPTMVEEMDPGSHAANTYVSIRALWEAFAPMLFIVLIVSLTRCGEEGLAARLCRWKPINYIGDISMAFYMTHILVLQFFTLIFNSSSYGQTPLWLLGLAMLVSLSVGATLTQCFEAPLRRLLRS
eukprot:TRINITY_DN50752_c0_g1_i1.p1 TRINITY_DN50752_c0_g1~~TRINITY_DN50752_c0_g1_i1.p1  ORF type:complete len:523 (+),score=80.02 TRINITY_DN50752_c0_g1_i1:159-1571(+)